MSYEFYKIIHYLAIFAVFLGLGGAIMAQMLNKGPKYPEKKIVAITHGVGMLAILVSGFGLLARLGVVGNTPPWVWIKLTIWLGFGAMLALVHRFNQKSKLWWILTLVLGFAAILTVIYKPI
jgi:uncharacterized membrane protein